MRVIIRFKGGPGSGHHGHRGIPGQRGGSLPGAGGYTEHAVTATALKNAKVGDKIVYYSKSGNPSYGEIVKDNGDGTFQVATYRDRRNPDGELPANPKTSRLDARFATDRTKLLGSDGDADTVAKLPIDVKAADDMWFEYDNANVIKAISAGDENPTANATYSYSAAEVDKMRDAAITLQTLASTENSGHNVVWRGASMLPEYVDEYTRKGETTLRGLTAASPSKAIASNYLDDQYSGGEGVPVLFKITNNTGVVGHNTVSGFAGTGGETVLAHNSKYNITDYRDINGVLQVTMQQLED